jgi:hypothetical protein
MTLEIWSHSTLSRRQENLKASQLVSTIKSKRSRRKPHSRTPVITPKVTFKRHNWKCSWKSLGTNKTWKHPGFYRISTSLMLKQSNSCITMILLGSERCHASRKKPSPTSCLLKLSRTLWWSWSCEKWRTKLNMLIWSIARSMRSRLSSSKMPKSTQRNYFPKNINRLITSQRKRELNSDLYLLNCALECLSYSN